MTRNNELINYNGRLVRIVGWIGDNIVLVLVDGAVLRLRLEELSA